MRRLFTTIPLLLLSAAMAFAQPVLKALDWPSILVGNLLAAATMAVYFWRRHPHLKIEP